MIEKTIHIDWEKDTIVRPMWYHISNLTQTASGYGRQLVTDRMIRYNNRLHRIYCCIYSNSGTHYIISKGNWIVIA